MTNEQTEILRVKILWAQKWEESKINLRFDVFEAYAAQIFSNPKSSKLFCPTTGLTIIKQPKGNTYTHGKEY